MRGGEMDEMRWWDEMRWDEMRWGEIEVKNKTFVLVDLSLELKVKLGLNLLSCKYILVGLW